MAKFKFKDITGQTFTRLKALGYVGSNKAGLAMWSCICRCGQEVVVSGTDLRKGHTRSCGCLAVDVVIARSTKHGCATRKKTIPEFHIWHAMNQRCYDKNYKDYYLYGGRGIKVCERWRKSFKNFFTDMGLRPSSKHSLDRKNSDGDYTLENCRWATAIEQANNKRNNIRLTWMGKTQTIHQWAMDLGITAARLRSRYEKGWEVERMFTQPIRRRTHASI